MRCNPRFSPIAVAIAGFTLVELMVALVAGLIVSAAVLAFFFSSMKSNGEYVQSTRLTQELRNILDLMSRDVRRAGSDDDSLKYVGNTNLSQFTPMCLTAAGAPSTCVGTGGVGDCIVYGYDRSYPNGGTTLVGTLGMLDVSKGEVRGLRRRTATVNGTTVGVIEYAESSGATKPSCGGAEAVYTSFPPTCNTTSLWCPLSDPARVDITQLQITNNSSQVGVNPSALLTRNFDFRLTGRLPANSDFTRDVQASLKIRSDCMRAAISNCNASP